MMLSCAGLAPVCGPTGTSPCCGSTPLPGGTFLRGDDAGSDGLFVDTADSATVSGFTLDIYPVTVGRFRQFVTAQMGTQANPPAAGAGARMLNGMAGQGGWDASWNTNLATTTAALTTALHCRTGFETWTDAAGANEGKPINCVTSYEAIAFCIWDGGFLQTETQWHFAASGGAEQRPYPWSNPPASTTIDCTYADSDVGAICVLPSGGANVVGSESPKGDGKWGHADLVGNVTEWTIDWWHSQYVNPCTDCADLTSATSRATRGGYYNSGMVRVPIRGRATANVRSDQIGFRCVRP